MLDILNQLAPALFKGGVASDYEVGLDRAGGFLTRHLPTGQTVPYVKCPPFSLPDVTRSPVPGGGVAMPWLAALNLGVSVVNLGVSTWTAVKVYRMDKKLDGISGSLSVLDHKVDHVATFLDQSVSQIKGLIAEQSLLFGVLHDQNLDLRQDIADLRRDLIQGFGAVQARITSETARREAEELEQKFRELARYYELCSTELRYGRRPALADLRMIIELATRIIAWLDMRLAAIPSGSAHRYPLLMMRAVALRVEIDARDELDNAPSGRYLELEDLARTVRAEIHHIAASVSVYARATSQGGLLAQYVVLNRALSAPVTVIETGDGQLIPYAPQLAAPWDDGLEPLRAVFDADQEHLAPARITLTTLKEHAAWENLSGLPRGSSRPIVTREDYMQVLGLPPEVALTENKFRELLEVGPGALAEARTRLSREIA